MCMTRHLHMQVSWGEGWDMSVQYWPETMWTADFNGIPYGKITMVTFMFLNRLIWNQDLCSNIKGKAHLINSSMDIQESYLPSKLPFIH